MKIYQTNKKVISFKGKVESFLNGITSNTLDAPNNAFLTVHGRIVATFDQLKVEADEFWICIEAGYVNAVLEHIDRYVKLSGITVEQKKLNVYFDIQGDYKIQPGDHAIVGAYCNTPLLVITPHELQTNISDREFALFRLKHNIPLHGVDYTDEMLLNVSEENFVSFTKGCFLGQEPIAKVHNRSKPTWKLVVKNEEDCSEEEKNKMTSKAIDPQSGKAMGFVFVKNH